MSLALFLTLLVLLLVGVWRFNPFDVEIPEECHFKDMPCASPCLLDDSASSTTLPHRAK